MPKISQEKIQKVSESILSHLFSIFPRPVFTADISKEIARDEEFTKRLLLELEKKELVVRVDKNPQGFSYTKRLRWRLSNKSYEVYKKFQKA